MSRLSDLRAAATLEEMRSLPGHCHELEGDRESQLSIVLTDTHRLVINASSGWPMDEATGDHSWAGIDAVHVLEIVDEPEN